MVHAADLRGSLRSALEPEPRDEPQRGERAASVLAPMIESDDPTLIFTVRSAGLSRHAGEISFPGGLQDPGERLVDTALREASEEIGLAPSDVEILGALPAVHTSVSGIMVVPFVAVLATSPMLTPDRDEIERVLTFQISQLSRAEAAVTHRADDGRVWHGFAYELSGHTIWGATGWMVHALLELMRKEVPWMMK
jgi:8-oxo-dGTP pyrophosphatase MutT (NUDIX family)